ncbi:MAG: hypothetical protein IKV48_00985 [Eggerthellaceae bacterium]|nr:hypothetical protein [Eggerthellaceae bacterium]
MGEKPKIASKAYLSPYVHDAADGDIWVMIVGRNEAGFSLSFAKDKETIIDAEFKCQPMDDEGTLITYIEELRQSAAG